MVKILLLLSLLLPSSFLNAGLFKIFETEAQKAAAIPRFPTTIEEKREQHKRLTELLENLEKNNQEFTDNIELEIKEIDRQRTEYKQKGDAATGSEVDFYNQARTLLNEQYQTLVNLKFTRKEAVSTLKQHIALLEELFKDPTFSNITTNPHAYYTYEDLQKLSAKALGTKEKLAHLEQLKAESSVDLENRKRKLTTLTKEYEEKKKEQEAFGSRSTPEEIEKDLTFRQKGQLIDLELKYIEYEKKLLEMRIDEAKSRINFLESSMAIENEKKRLYRNDMARVRDRLRIDIKDLETTNQTLEETKKKSSARRDQLLQEVQDLNAQKNILTKELEILQDRYKKIDIAVTNLGDWSITPKTIDEWIALCELGFKYEQLQLLDSTINHLNAQIDLERAVLLQQEINYTIHKTLYNLIHRKIKTDDELRNELKKFQDWESERRREEARFKEKAIAASNTLNLDDKKLANITNLLEELKKLQDTLFKYSQNKFKFCEIRLRQIRTTVENQINVIENRIKTYTTLTTIANATAQNLSSINAELESKSIWQRSAGAISFRGIRAIPSDIKIFTRTLYNLTKSFIAGLTIHNLFSWVKNSILMHPFDLLNLLLQLILLVALFFIIRRYIRKAIHYLTELSAENKFSVIVARTGAGVFSFIHAHYISLFIWITLLIIIQTDYISDIFLHVIFYLGSIAYLCYIVHAFVVHFIHFNADQNYIIFNSNFEKRFSFIVSLFGYLTAFLLLLREAFIAVTYHPSEFPTILMALYTTLTPIIIIPLIGKEELLGLIPKKGFLWKSASEFIDNYYYPLLAFAIIIIILTDPRVGGYGNLVTYFFWGIIGSIILLKLLMVTQNYVRRSTSRLFFYEDDDQVRERFKYSTTWFGLLVIAFFVLFVFIGIIIGLRIWGIPVTAQEIVKFFTQLEFISAGVDDAGKPIWITPYRILGIVVYILSGFLIAYAINTFVIRRIFQVLPVDLGVQNTVTSLIRYIVIVAAIYLGFQMAGLSNLLLLIGVAIGSIAYLNKEPLADFIGYFLILVQRPVKIGDYIVIDSSKELSGVVRQITARSTILRSKNSFSVIVPNATIINHVIKNWNYAGVFIAVDDLELVVPYSVNPEKIRMILSKVCEDNPEILRNPRPIIRLNNFSENGYAFLLRAFISSSKTLLMWDIASELRFCIVRELQKNGVALAFPTRVVISAKSDTHTYHPNVHAAD